MKIEALGSEDMSFGPMYPDEALFPALVEPDSLLLRVEPVSPDLVNHTVQDLAARTGIDAYTWRQKLIGYGVSLINAQPGMNLDQISNAMQDYGIPSLPLNRRALLNLPTAPRTQTLRLSGSRLEFLGRHQQRVFDFEPGDKLLVVLADASGKHAVKELGRAARRNSPARMDNPDTLSPEEYVLREEPLMYLFSEAYPQGTVLSVTGVNYTGLGQFNQKSGRANLRWLLTTMQRHAESVHIDTRYGLGIIPGLPGSSDNARLAKTHDGREQMLRTVGKYANLARLAYVQGMFRPWSKGSLFDPERIQQDVERLHVEQNLPTREEARAIRNQAKVTRHKRFWHSMNQAVKKLGPPKFVLGFTGLIIACGVLSVWLRNPTFFALGTGVSALGQLILAFVQWKRKRLIEDLPTSKLNSMAMGLVEVTGQVTPVVPMYAPFSGVECVACDYVLQQEQAYGTEPGQKGYVTVRSGMLDCGLFWLKDENGQCLVDTKHLIWDLHNTHSLSGNLHFNFPITPGGASMGLGPGERVVETFLPTGATVYLVGVAERRTFNPNESLEDIFRRKLRELKGNQDKLMAYDLNDNGVIDSDEWAIARDAARNQAELEHAVADAPQEAVVVHAGDQEGFFYLSDEGEESVKLRISANMILRWVVGLILAGLAGYYLTEAGEQSFEGAMHKTPSVEQLLEETLTHP